MVALVCCWVLYVLQASASPESSDRFESLLASAQDAQARRDFQAAADFYRQAAEIIPENAVVVPGSRAISKGKAAEWGLSLYTPVIVKYRDDKTDSSIELEHLLR